MRFGLAPALRGRRDPHRFRNDEKYVGRLLGWTMDRLEAHLSVGSNLETHPGNEIAVRQIADVGHGFKVLKPWHAITQVVTQIGLN